LLGSISKTANKAAIGANKMTEKPRYAVKINNPKANKIIMTSINIPPYPYLNLIEK
jgi:hypothetical protein